MLQDQAVAPRFWTTATFGEAADTSPMELAALRDHLSSCNDARGRWFTLRCLADKMDGFMASRFVTSLAIAGVLVVAGSMLL